MSFSVIHWNIDPYLIPSLGLVRWYSLMWLLGVVVGYAMIKHMYRKENVEEEELQKLAITIMIAAVVGARLGHVFFYDWAYYSQHPIEILPFRISPRFEFTGLAGLASHGGVIGALIGLYIYNRKRDFKYAWLLDRLTIGGAVLGGFIRLGNFFNSEILGKASNTAWAVVFTRIDQLPRHPAQLYEAIFYWFIGLFLFRLWKKNGSEQQQGFIFGLGIFLIFLQRFLVEFLKENQVAFENDLLLNMGQILSIPLAILGLIIAWRASRKRPETSITSM